MPRKAEECKILMGTNGDIYFSENRRPLGSESKGTTEHQSGSSTEYKSERYTQVSRYSVPCNVAGRGNFFVYLFKKYFHLESIR